VLVSALIGTAYSLPPLRLKRFALFASLCIFTVRGLVVNFGIYWYFRALVAKAPAFDPPVVVLSLFVTVFTFVIALFKDLPDMEGDRRFDVSTFSLRLGKRYVFDLCCGVLVANYLLVLAVGGLFADSVNLVFLGAAHLLQLAAFVYLSRRVDLKSDAEIYGFYQFIWKLYYIEYLVLPLAWLWG
jgi:homogentisate phytyltransferase/homogentisate geranylgeranyltransferase